MELEIHESASCCSLQSSSEPWVPMHTVSPQEKAHFYSRGSILPEELDWVWPCVSWKGLLV